MVPIYLRFSVEALSHTGAPSTDLLLDSVPTPFRRYPKGVLRDIFLHTLCSVSRGTQEQPHNSDFPLVPGTSLEQVHQGFE